MLVWEPIYPSQEPVLDQGSIAGLEDMEASLFSSFNSQKRGRRSREKMAVTSRGSLNLSSQLSKESNSMKTSRQSIREKLPQDRESLQGRKGIVNAGDEHKGALSPSTANPSVATSSRGENSLFERPKSSSGIIISM